MAWTYMLECSDGSFYMGSTKDLELRFEQHQNGEGASYTRRRRPVTLVWAVESGSPAEAYDLEKQIQGWSRAKRQALIDGRWNDLPTLSGSKYVRARVRRGPAA